MSPATVALISHASHEIVQRRHEIIKPHLHRDYIELCSQEVPVTSLLFGDHLQTRTDPHSGQQTKNGNTCNEPITHAKSTAELQAKYQQLWQQTASIFMAREPSRTIRLEHNSKRGQNRVKNRARFEQIKK